MTTAEKITYHHAEWRRTGIQQYRDLAYDTYIIRGFLTSQDNL